MNRTIQLKRIERKIYIRGSILYTKTKRSMEKHSATITKDNRQAIQKAMRGEIFVEKILKQAYYVPNNLCRVLANIKLLRTWNNFKNFASQ